MALGGGNFLVQNKVLPGTYINFVSVPRASNIFGDRGYAAIALEMDWGADGITTVEASDLQRHAMELFGVEYTDIALRPLREILMYAKTVYVGRLNGGGVKATATVGALTATAKYAGTKGNSIKIVVENDIENVGNFVVKTFLDAVEVDRQSVAVISDLKDNECVLFSGTESLTANSGVNLIGGTNAEVTTKSHSDFLEELEKRYFNVVGYYGTDEAIKGLYAAFVKRLRDDEGVKIQAVLFNKAANHEGVINLNAEAVEGAHFLVPWVTGISAGCAVNKSNTNMKYDGELTVSADYKQRDLIAAITRGEFVFHMVDGEPRVLSDINSFTEFTLEKNEDFAQNQNIRVIDQIAMDVANIFNTRYLGKVQNNADGRIAFWNEIVTHGNTLQKLGAIQDFTGEDIIVNPGIAKDAVDVSYTVYPVMAMQKLYMIVRIV